MTLEAIDSTPELLPARADTDSWVDVVRQVTLLSQQIAGTEFVPRGLRDSIPATAAAILYGREIGLPPMTALSQINVVEGRPGLSAEAMRALVLAAGHEIVFDETTSAICRVRGRRHRSQTWTTVEWTIEHARQAGLLRRGSGWEKYPRDMLIARGTTALCRMIFPDVIHGFRSVEELVDMDDTTPGEPIDAPKTRRTTRVSRRTKTPPPELPSPDETAVAPIPTTADESRAAVHTLPHREPSLPGEEDSPTTEDVEAPTPPPPSSDAASSSAQEPPTPSTPAPSKRDPDLVNNVTMKLIFGQLRRLGISDKTDDDREERLLILGALSGRENLSTSRDLTQDEGTTVATILSTLRDRDALDEVLSVASIRDIARDQLPLDLEDTTAKTETEET